MRLAIMPRGWARWLAVTLAAMAMTVFVSLSPASADPFADDGGTFNCGVGYGTIQVRFSGVLRIYLYTANNPNGYEWKTSTAGGFTTRTFYTNLHRARWYAVAGGMNTTETFSNCGYR